MRKLLSSFLIAILTIMIIPFSNINAHAQDASIFSGNDFSVYVEGQEVPVKLLTPYDNYYLEVPSSVEYFTIKKGSTEVPNLIWLEHGELWYGIGDGTYRYDWLDEVWSGANYDSEKGEYTIPVSEINVPGTWSSYGSQYQGPDVNYDGWLHLAIDGNGANLYVKIVEAKDSPETSVINAIAELPKTVTLENKEAVEAARAAYDALDDAAKANVTNYQTLVIAELTIEKLQLQADKTELQSNLDKAEEALEQSKANEEKLQSDLDQVKEDLGTVNGEKEGLQEQLNEKKEELATAQQETTALTEQVDTLKKDIKEKDDELKSVKEELATAKVTPEKVVITSVVNKKAKKAVVKWAKAPKATGYEVYRKVGKSGSYKKVKTISKASTVSFTNSKLKKGKTYYYKVRAVNKTNGKTTFGAFSAVKKVKIKK